MGIAENIAQVRLKIARAARRSGRDPREITLVAVSKTVGLETVAEAMAQGLTHFGENRAHELKWKQEHFPTPLAYDWPFADQQGQAGGRFGGVDPFLDRWSLAEEMNKRGSLLNTPVSALLQVSLAGEKQKAGVLASDIDQFLQSVGQLQWLRIEGLMTMAPLSEDSEKSRPIFKELCAIYRCYKRKTYQNVDMRHLSMGMSQDFEVAIEEGATIVRVGTALFGEHKR